MSNPRTPEDLLIQSQRTRELVSSDSRQSSSSRDPPPQHRISPVLNITDNRLDLPHSHSRPHPQSAPSWSYQHHSHVPATDSNSDPQNTMIGPAPTFCDPEQAVLQQNTSDYHQWFESDGRSAPQHLDYLRPEQIVTSQNRPHPRSQLVPVHPQQHQQHPQQYTHIQPSRSARLPVGANDYQFQTQLAPGQASGQQYAQIQQPSNSSYPQVQQQSRSGQAQPTPYQPAPTVTRPTIPVSSYYPPGIPQQHQQRQVSQAQPEQMMPSSLQQQQAHVSQSQDPYYYQSDTSFASQQQQPAQTLSRPRSQTHSPASIPDPVTYTPSSELFNLPSRASPAGSYLSPASYNSSSIEELPPPKCDYSNQGTQQGQRQSQDLASQPHPMTAQTPSASSSVHNVRTASHTPPQPSHQFQFNAPARSQVVQAVYKRGRGPSKPPGGRVPKRPRPTPGGSSSGRPGNRFAGGGDGFSESDDDDTGSPVIVEQARPRKPGACAYCKRLKMRCEFKGDSNSCERCKTGNHRCHVEGRKPRIIPNKREYLMAQIKQKDSVIESLLKQLHNPYTATPLSIASYRMATSPSDKNKECIISWMDRLQSSVAKAGTSAGPTAFTLDARPGRSPADDSDDDQTSPVGAGDGEDDDSSTHETEKLQAALPDAVVPIGLLANLSLDKSKRHTKGAGARTSAAVKLEEDDNNDVGVANKGYFLPGPATDLNIRKILIEQHSAPEILVHNLVTASDVDKLFDIFYKHVNPFISLLDPVLHTPESTFARCPFLFTVVCAVSSRYYTEKTEIYPIAMHFAKHAAANALIEGWKSVELCQAYILMSIYSVPARRWEEDRSWLYTGLAVRIATDLNLHQVATTVPHNEQEEREILNRTRVWMICYNLDWSTATQFGKPSSVKEDYIVRNSKDWYKKSQYNIKYDLHMCAHSSLLRIVGRFHDEIFSDQNSPTGLNKQMDFRSVTLAHDEHLSSYFEEWSKRFAEESDRGDRGASFRCTLLPFYVDYSRLVMFSFGFQQAFQRGIEPSDQFFFRKCFDAAKSVITHMIEVLAPSKYMRHAPDGHFVFVSFASAFLLKMLHPEIRQLLLSQELENEIFDLVTRLIHTLSSPEVAIDDRHTPKLYARFLAGLLTKHRKDSAAVSGRHQPLPPKSQTVQRTQGDFQGHGPSSSSGVFNTPQPYGNAPQQRQDETDYSQMTHSLSKEASAVFAPEITYISDQGQIDFGLSDDLGMMDGIMTGVSDEEMLATMHAIKNPSFWQNMMMPGFSWPAMNAGMDATYHQSMSNMHQTLGGFPITEMPLASVAM